MVAAQPKPKSKMVHAWTSDERHCLHLLVTHYPDSSWADRAAICNRVFGHNFIIGIWRDEYGGHKAGQRNRPNGKKPSRSTMWHDDICRDVFEIAGGFDARQQLDRLNILQRIQAAITQLGLSGSPGLGAVDVRPGRINAATNVMVTAATYVAPAVVAAPAPAAPAPVVAPTPTGQATASSSAPAGNTAGNDDDDDDAEADEDNDETDPAMGARDFYHSRELPRVGEEFVYTPVPGISYDVTPSKTWRRTVRFPNNLIMVVQTCDLASYRVCGRRVRGG